jgi:hypothetical protein
MRTTGRSYFVSFVSLCLISAGAGAALKAATMAVPADFESRVERHVVTGFGGANRGQYSVGEFGGEFTRSESRLAVFDPVFAKNSGTSSFSLGGPGIAGAVSASCTFAEGVATIGVVTFDPKKLAYQCAIARDGNDDFGRLTIGSPRPASFKERMLAQSIRVGAAEVDGLAVGIRSAHEYAGSRLRSATPVGYLFSIDDAVVGGVELTGTDPVILMASDAAPEMRQATLVVALSLAVFRDPADSALGDSLP